MKELEKTKRISIASTLFILAILIGVLTFERPKNTYALNTKSTLEKLTTNDYFISVNEIKRENFKLIDIRSQYDYDKGHIENAINMASSDIITEENQALLTELKNSNKTAVIYGNKPAQANIPFLILYQLGFDNIKLLPVELDYYQNKLIVSPTEVEKSKQDIKSFIEESVKNAKVEAPVNVVKPIKKKVVVVQKKKKKAPEGGC